MSELFEGYVIDGAKGARSNGPTTSPPSSGVVRDIKRIPETYNSTLRACAPELVDLNADQYRAAVLESSLEGTTEYLVWAANSAQMGVFTGNPMNSLNSEGEKVQDPWVQSDANADLAPGEREVFDAGRAKKRKEDADNATISPLRTDGGNKVIVADKGNRSIAQILSVTLVRGDNRQQQLILVAEGAEHNPNHVDPDDEYTAKVIPDAFERVDADAGLIQIKESILEEYFGNKVHGGETQEEHGSYPQQTTVNKAVDGAEVSTRVTYPGDPNEAHVEVQGGIEVQGKCGLSKARGDIVQNVRYFVSPATFWWTRNDIYAKRFGYNARKQKWAPYKGSSIWCCGYLDIGVSYELDPAPRNLEEGDFLPGVVEGGDEGYAMIRIGSRPGSGAMPIGDNQNPDPDEFYGIRVVSNDEAKEEYIFSNEASRWAGVVGVTNGLLQFNPAFTLKYAGQKIFYSNLTFKDDADGRVGPLLGSYMEPLFIAPIPTPGQRPFIKIGTRRFLTPIMVDTDADLEAVSSLSESDVVVSMSTGRLRFHPSLSAKADPDDPGFDPAYLGAVVNYDGVALNEVPQPTRQPVQIVGSAGNAVNSLADYDGRLYLPVADPFGSRGLGTSGIIHEYDQTGVVPNTKGPVSARRGGDTSSATASGLVRAISSKRPTFGGSTRYRGDFGDVFFFIPGRWMTDTDVYLNKEAGGWPDSTRKIKKQRAVVSMTSSGGPSEACEVQVNKKKRSCPLYFIQSDLTPATYTTKARLTSRVRFEFTFDEYDKFYFSVNDSYYEWSASSIVTDTDSTFYAEEVAENLYQNSVEISVDGDSIVYGGLLSESEGASISVVNGYVVIESTLEEGSVEIGWGGDLDRVKDLSGCSSLGFLPGWRAETSSEGNWIPDSGLSFGMYRSALNENGLDPIADFTHRFRANNVVLHKKVQASSPINMLDFPPIQDIPGYDENIFFKLETSITKSGRVIPITKYLKHLEDVIYRFGQSYFAWLEKSEISESVKSPTQYLFLGKENVVQESLLGCEPNPSHGLYISETGGSYTSINLGSDYLLYENGVPGTALLIEKIGSQITFGSQGTFEAGSTTFTNLFSPFSPDFSDESLGITAGCQLKLLSGDAQGTYIITQVDGANLEVTPPFLAEGSVVPWEIYEGLDYDTYDESLVADYKFDVFNHMPQEPFQIRILSPLTREDHSWAMPTDKAHQESARLKCTVADAIRNKRDVSIRFGNELGETPKESLDHIAEHTAEVYFLDIKTLGEIQNNLVYLHDVESLRVTTKKFSLLLGSEKFSYGDFVEVEEFSENPGDGEGIEYLSTTGELKFGTKIIEDYSSAEVHQIDEFLDPDDLEAGLVECNPKNGEFNFSTADMETYKGRWVDEDGVEDTSGLPIPTEIAPDTPEDLAVQSLNWQETVPYFVERMITEQRTDVAISPVAGAFNFRRYMLEYQIAEVDYFGGKPSGELDYVKDDGGNDTEEPLRVIEHLPIYVKSEVCTRIDEFTYSFNPPDVRGRTRTPIPEVEPTVYVGIIMQNYSDDHCTVDFDRGLIKFNANYPVDLDYTQPKNAAVTISYAIKDAYGGEVSFTSSVQPIFRPPFFLEKYQDTFKLKGDRSDEMEVGQMVGLGPHVFYVKSVSYDADPENPGDSETASPWMDLPDALMGDEPGETTVTLYPSPTTEAGSRSPGNDAPFLLSCFPLAWSVDPDSDSVVDTEAPRGFLKEIEEAWEPVSRNNLDITFQGNLMRYARAGHVIEVGGVPFLIVNGRMSPDGRRTTVSVSYPFPASFSKADGHKVYLSYRPIYFPDPMKFIGVHPFVPYEGHEVTLFGEKNAEGSEKPGRRLIPSVDYSIDQDTGLIEFIGFQAPLQSQERLHIRYTKLKTLAPIVGEDGVPQYPRYFSRYRHAVTPSIQNTYLNAALLARYTFDFPDAFYCRVVPFAEYMQEFKVEAATEMAALGGGGGSGPMMGDGSLQDKDFGAMSFPSERMLLENKDRAARELLSIYNQAVTYFEQVDEAITGRIVGDRDGKFRFWIGKGKEYAPPGFEDSISGTLNNRNIWQRVSNNHNPVSIVLEFNDWICEEGGFIDAEAAYQLEGDIPDVDYLDHLIKKQKKFILNDVDDIILDRHGRYRIDWQWLYGIFPWPRFRFKGKYERLHDPNNFSRLYPNKTTAFTLSGPGVESNLKNGNKGFYTMLDFKWDDWRLKVLSTWKKTIGQLANPVLGEDIKGVDSGGSSMTRRHPRARVFGFYPYGLEAGALGKVSGLGRVTGVTVLDGGIGYAKGEYLKIKNADGTDDDKSDPASIIVEEVSDDGVIIKAVVLNQGRKTSDDDPYSGDEVVDADDTFFLDPNDPIAPITPGVGSGAVVELKFGKSPSFKTSSPCLIASIVELKDFPIDPNSGTPDLDRLRTQGGDVYDLSTGDPDLLTPWWHHEIFGWWNKQMNVGGGYPDGQMFSLVAEIDGFAGTSISDVLIDKIQYGCLITFKNFDGDPVPAGGLKRRLTSEQSIYLGKEDWGYGDTVIANSTVAPDLDEDELEDLSDEQKQTLMQSISADYDVGRDVGLSRSGRVYDKTLLHWTPGFFLFDWQMVVGQRPVKPLMFLESNVEFLYRGMAPVLFPALLGEDKNDYGDYTLPYMKTSNTELDRFAEITDSMAQVVATKTSWIPGHTYVGDRISVYPDEILCSDGDVLPSLGASDPAILTTVRTVDPFSDPPGLEGVEGVGDAEPFDLILVEPNSGGESHPAASSGFLSIATAEWDEDKNLSSVEVPRFISHTPNKREIPGNGTEVVYTLENAIVCPNDSFIHIIEDRRRDGVTINPHSDLTLGFPDQPYPLGPSHTWIDCSGVSFRMCDGFAPSTDTDTEDAPYASGWPRWYDNGTPIPAPKPEYEPDSGLNRIAAANAANQVELRMFANHWFEEDGATYFEGDTIEKVVLKAGQVETTVGLDTTDMVPQAIYFGVNPPSSDTGDEFSPGESQTFGGVPEVGSVGDWQHAKSLNYTAILIKSENPVGDAAGKDTVFNLQYKYLRQPACADPANPLVTVFGFNVEPHRFGEIEEIDLTGEVIPPTIEDPLNPGTFILNPDAGTGLIYRTSSTASVERLEEPGVVDDLDNYFGGVFSLGSVDSPITSNTAFISEDRLTFNEVVDLRKTTHRGGPSTGGLVVNSAGHDIMTKLTVWSHDIYDTNAGSKVQSEAVQSVNGWAADAVGNVVPCPFTFQPRDEEFVPGTWKDAETDGGASDGQENGSLKVMSFEGHRTIGTGCAATAEFDDDGVMSIVVDDAGSGYLGGHIEVVIDLPVGVRRPTKAVAVVDSDPESETYTGISEIVVLQQGGHLPAAPPNVQVVHYPANIPVDSNLLNFSLIPSCPRMETEQVYYPTTLQGYNNGGVICRGVGVIKHRFQGDADNFAPVDNIISGIEIDPTEPWGRDALGAPDGKFQGGNVNRVQNGDVLTIKQSSDSEFKATAKAGTYLVRHTLDKDGHPDYIDNDYAQASPESQVGSGSNWVDVVFPLTSGIRATLLEDGTIGEVAVTLTHLNRFGESFDLICKDDDGAPLTDDEGFVIAVLTTPFPHKLVNGETVKIHGVQSTAAADLVLFNKEHEITWIDVVTFSVRLGNPGTEILGDIDVGVARMVGDHMPTPPHVAAGLEDYGAFPNPNQAPWNEAATPPRLFFVASLRSPDPDSSSQGPQYAQVISAAYTADSDPTKNYFVLDPESFVGADNEAIENLAFKDSSTPVLKDFFVEDDLILEGVEPPPVPDWLQASTPLKITTGLKTSGMVYLPINFNGLAITSIRPAGEADIGGGEMKFFMPFSTLLPANNVVMGDLENTVFGMKHLTVFAGPKPVPCTALEENNGHYFKLDDSNFVDVDVWGVRLGAYEPPEAGEIGFDVLQKRTSTVFRKDVTDPVYDNILGLMDLTGVMLTGTPGNDAEDTFWTTGADAWLVDPDTQHPIHVRKGARCLIPGDTFGAFDLDMTRAAADVENIEPEDGVRFAAGIFLEPSFPRPVQNLLGDVDLTDWSFSEHERLVDRETSFDDPVLEDSLGLRFEDAAGADEGIDEGVEFEVRRIRRFHEIQDNITANFAPLRYAYEIRRGIITGYATESQSYATVDEITPETVLSYSTAEKGFGILSAKNFMYPVGHDLYREGDSYTGTQLGPFADEVPEKVESKSASDTLRWHPHEDVNIHAGDIVRVIDTTKKKSLSVVDECEIEKIVGTGDLLLAPPAITDPSFIAEFESDEGFTEGRWHFEVYLRQAPVPHEQSNEQLLSMITLDTVHETQVDRTLEEGTQRPLNTTGGFVEAYDPEALEDGDFVNDYADFVNILRDDSLEVSDEGVPTQTFVSMGVAEGDILLVDPAGVVAGDYPTEEEGMWGYGDRSISSRRDTTGEDTVFEAKPTDPLDDNRGYYKVTKVEELSLEVEGGYAGEFAGVSSDFDVVFPNNPTAQIDRGYAIYPTVSGSAISRSSDASKDGREGQMDLRPTRFMGVKNDGTEYAPDEANYTSFRGSDFSIRPFSYRILRPNPMFTEETIELVLMNRERILSLMQQLRIPMRGEKSGSYFVFQRDAHARELGVDGLPNTGKGVFRNDSIGDLNGEIGVVPYTNSPDGISILDRRFVIQDPLLNLTTSAGDGFQTIMTSDGEAPSVPVGEGDDPEMRVVPYASFEEYEATPDSQFDALGSSVRPLLLDHIEIALDVRDRFRESRYSWLLYRTHRIEGSLQKIRQWDRAYPDKVRKRRQYLKRKAGLK